MNIKIFGNNPKLWQWDTGRKLVVEGSGDCNEVHFADSNGEIAIVRPIVEENGLRIVSVPNTILQRSAPMTAYLYYDDNSGTRTYAAFCFYIVSRPRPENYVDTEGATAQ